MRKLEALVPTIQLNWVTENPSKITRRPRVQSSGLKVLTRLFGVTLISKVLGFLSQVLVTAFYGTTRLADTFYFSISIQNIVAGGVGGSAPAVLIPSIMAIRGRDGDKAARQFTSGVLTWFFIALSLIAAVMAWQASNVIIGLGAFSHDSRRLSIAVFQCCAPVLVLLGFLQLLIAVSQAESRFLAPAALGILHSAVFIAAVAALHMRLRVFALTAAMAFGVLTQVVVLFVYLQHGGGKLRPTFRMTRQYAADFLRLWWPLLISQLLGIIQVTASRSIASSLPVGSLAALSYAESLKSVFLELAVTPVAVMTFPVFVQKILSGDLRTTWNDLQLRMLGLWFFLVPAIVLIWAFSRPLIGMLYQRGHFTVQSTDLTASALSIYSFGLLAESGHYLVSRFYLALKDAHTLTWLGLPTTGLFLISSHYASRRLLHNGIAASYVLMVTLGMVLAFFILKKRIQLPVLQAFLHGSCKLVVAAGIMLASIRILFLLQQESAAADLRARIGWFLFTAVASLSIYLGTALALGIVGDCPFIARLHPFRIQKARA